MKYRRFYKRVGGDYGLTRKPCGPIKNLFMNIRYGLGFRNGINKEQTHA